jgi:hypothetical protein
MSQRIKVAPRPGFDEDVRAAVEGWLNERGPGPTPDPRVGKPVRVTDATRVEAATKVVDWSSCPPRARWFDLFLAHGVVEGVSEEGLLVVKTDKGTFALNESEVKFL